MAEWKTLDTKRVLDRQRRQQEATTSAGVGGYVGPAFRVPEPFRRQVPIVKKAKKKKDR